jgi:hypothetical protein
MSSGPIIGTFVYIALGSLAMYLPPPSLAFIPACIPFLSMLRLMLDLRRVRSSPTSRVAPRHSLPSHANNCMHFIL